jgi:hypothetical protein
MLLASFVVIAATSCGGDEPVQDSNPTTVSSPTSVAAGQAPATTARPLGTTLAPAVVAVVADPCDLLTADEVEAVTGHPVVAVRPYPPMACDFDLGPELEVYVQTSVDDGMGRLAGPANLYADYSARHDEGTAEAVTVLGAAASYDPGFRAIAVDLGEGRYIAIGIGGRYTTLEEPREELVALAELMVARLQG